MDQNPKMGMLEQILSRGQGTLGLKPNVVITTACWFEKKSWICAHPLKQELRHIEVHLLL